MMPISTYKVLRPFTMSKFNKNILRSFLSTGKHAKNMHACIYGPYATYLGEYLCNFELCNIIVMDFLFYLILS